jgi:hypothetical protein
MKNSLFRPGKNDPEQNKPGQDSNEGPEISLNVWYERVAKSRHRV